MKLDKDYKKVIKILENDFGWNIEEPTEMEIRLINDTIKATKL